MVRIGITGHQKRPGIDWVWVNSATGNEIDRRAVERGLSSLAAGSDQVFADVCLSRGLPVTAVLPLKDYSGFFDGEGLANYRRLLSQCDLVQLDSQDSPEAAFFAAGRYIVENCDLLLAVWDGAPAKGLGGTSDVVAYARSVNREVVILNPIAKELS